MDSLKRQSNKNFKVFIGDDKSPEDPRSMLHEFDQDLDITYKYFSSNFGKRSLSQQWERCLDHAQETEWLMLLGDDDILSRDCVETFYNHVEFLNEEKINVFRFSTQIIDDCDTPLSVVFKDDLVQSSKRFLENRINGSNRSSLSENIFRTSIVKKIGFKSFPLGWHSDDLAVFEFSLYGNSKIFSSDDSVVLIRLSNLSISGNNNNDKVKNVASYKFYKYIILNYLTYFDPEFKFLLFRKLEKTIINNRSNSSLLFDISHFYLKQGLFKEYYKFLKKFLKSLRS